MPHVSVLGKSAYNFYTFKDIDNIIDSSTLNTYKVKKKESINLMLRFMQKSEERKKINS